MLPAVSLGLDNVNATLSAWRQNGRHPFSARVVSTEGHEWLAAVHAHPLETQTLWIVILAPVADFAPEWPWIALGIATALAALLALAALVARREAQRIAAPLQALAALAAPCRFKQLSGSASASIGAVMFGNGRESAEKLLKQADLAMYRSKAQGRNCLHFFVAGMAAAEGHLRPHRCRLTGMAHPRNALTP